MIEHKPALWGGLVGTISDITYYLEHREQQAIERMRPVGLFATRQVVAEAIMDCLAVRRKRNLIIQEGMKYDPEGELTQ